MSLQKLNGTIKSIRLILGFLAGMLVSILYFITIYYAITDRLIRNGYAHDITMKIMDIPICVFFIFLNVFITKTLKESLKDFSKAYLITTLISTIYIFLYFIFIGWTIRY